MAQPPNPNRLTRTHKLLGNVVITIRPIRSEDAAIEKKFVDNLSDSSRYYRFFYALKEITPSMVDRFTRIDPETETALIAVIGNPPGETEIGVARYSTLPDGESCEFAVVVADEWQGRGIGTRLMRPLVADARARGLSRMDGFVLFENSNMLKFVKALDFKVTADPGDPAVALVSLHL